MSKVKIVGNASGSGTLTLTGPNTNSDRTVTFPDATGTMMFTDSSVANLTGTLPAISGVNLTALNGTQVTSGTVPVARMAAGTVVSYKIVTLNPGAGISTTSTKGKFRSKFNFSAIFLEIKIL